MANKCLVTRLKAAIQNDDLPLFDTIKLEVVSSATSTANNYRLGLSVHDTNEGIIVKVDGNGYFANAYADLSDETKRMTQTSIFSGSTKNLYFANGPYNVYISNAHNIKSINIEGATKTNRSVFRLNLGELKNSPGIKTLSASQTNTYGSISDLPSTINDLMLTECGNVVGNINLVANKNIFSGHLWLGDTGITGSIEDYVAGQVSQGVEEYTSFLYNTLSSIIFRKNLTIGGVAPDVEIRYLSWSGTNRIICSDTAKLDTATTIYAKGATSEEISAWRQAGKTVVVITDAGE